ncbi:hypothetical protein PILCRDRAFT_823628 [Piloderma croceum F 1598]|uniref:Uncharacterized protein n=1 Tax=Piloderma croceum (strain F 1598) TaxID=765440 RepID=A0A0C3FHW3_PILCF|nr:hypothetical protein PILCRDRAFT_823628 [Piloderma croceum F 1598]
MKNDDLLQGAEEIPGAIGAVYIASVLDYNRSQLGRLISELSSAIGGGTSYLG